MGLLTKLGYMHGPRSRSGGPLLILMSLCLKDEPLAASPLISYSFAFWNSEKVMEAGGLPARNGGKKASVPWSPKGTCSASVMQKMSISVKFLQASIWGYERWKVGE